MTEQSQFWTTNGTGHGLVGGYTLTRWLDFFRKLFNMTQASEGVIPGVDSELAVSGSATPLTVAAGAALVYGFAYENTASLTLAVTTPAALTGGRVVLEANWTAQTVTAKISQSASGVTTPPALVQSAGTTWQISLATYTITSGGVITLTDARGYVHHATRVSSAMLDTSAVTAGKIATGGVSAAAQFAAGVVDSTALASNAVVAGKIATGGVSAAGQFAAGVVNTAALATTSVDDTIVGNRVPALTRRQGGSATEFGVAGTSTYTPGLVKMQCGAIAITFTAGNLTASVTVTYPLAWTYRPVILLTGAGPSYNVTAGVDSSGGGPTTTTFTILATRPNSSFTDVCVIYWQAVGL